MKKVLQTLLLFSILLACVACLQDAYFGGNGNPESPSKDADAFAHSVFLGDSITEGFAFHEILPRGAVMAGAGATAGYIYKAYMNDLIKKEPQKVYLMLGSVDLLMPVEDPQEYFRAAFLELVLAIQAELPDCTIIIQSITPVSTKALEEEERYQNIAVYNELLGQLAEDLAVDFVDIGALVEENLSLFAEDGVHFKKEFYLKWLAKLLEVS